MRHVYRCPLRWADLDLLGHVNNVRYVDYLQEARVDLMRTHAPDARAADLAEGVVVVSHRVTYRAPLTFRFRPVSIEVWLTEVRAASFTRAYEVFDEDEAGDRTVYLRATTLLTPYVFATERPRRLTDDEKAALSRVLEPEALPRPVPWTAVERREGGHYPLHVRFSDVDVYGHVNNVMYFEYLQEARIQLMARLAEGLPGAESATLQMVVAQTDVDYKRPILFRPEPYDVWSAIERVGRTSWTVVSEIVSGDEVFARARVVCVFFDPATGRAAEPPEEYRERLLAG